MSETKTIRDVFGDNPVLGQALPETKIAPVEYKVLIKLDEMENRTSGGIIIPDERHERDQMAQTEATLVAVGGIAFTDPDWGEPKPKPGDRVLVSKYAGERPNKDESNPYRLCMDKDICAILR